MVLYVIVNSPPTRRYVVFAIQVLLVILLNPFWLIFDRELDKSLDKPALKKCENASSFLLLSV